MKQKQRTTQLGSVTRTLLVDATKRLMVAEGYAAVTTRGVATKVGVTAAAVHYHFPTTEDLLVATFRHAIEGHDEQVRRALASNRPIHALWSILADSTYTTLAVEFMALANHRKTIKAEMARHSEFNRKHQAEALTELLVSAAISPDVCSPLCGVFLLDNLARGLVMEDALGISCAHSEARAFIEGVISQIEKGGRQTRVARPRREDRIKKSSARA